MRSAVLSRRCGAGLAIRSLVSQRQYCDSRKEWCHAVLPTRCVKSIGAISVVLLTQMAPGVGKRSFVGQSVTRSHVPIWTANHTQRQL